MAQPSEIPLASALDVEHLRADFPILSREVRGRTIAYLDNAATTQKPRAVIDAVSRYYEQTNGNVHRAVHVLSAESTQAFEGARRRVARFINAASEREVVFTRGTTESINLVANAWGNSNVREGDEILVTWIEHHSNIVPWQMLCERTGARLVPVPVNNAGEVEMEEFERLLCERTRLVAVGHVSNALGTINPVERMVELAHAAGALVLVDGAQGVSHLPVDVRALGADFYAFSGHKVFGPTGIGVLYGREALLEAMPPWQGGGDMIRSVSFEGTTYNELPYKFEAGTPDISGAIGLAAALDYLDSAGIAAISAWENELLEYATEKLLQVEGLRIIGTARRKASVISFVLESAHPHDIGTIVDGEGVAIRTGHHCAEPLMRRFGVPATARASMAFYNTREEIDRLAAALETVNSMFGG